MEQPHNLPLKVYQDERDYMMVPGFHTGSLILICFFYRRHSRTPKVVQQAEGHLERGM